MQAVNETVQLFFVALYSLYAGKVHNLPSDLSNM
jgi:hypothetical protein